MMGGSAESGQSGGRAVRRYTAGDFDEARREFEEVVLAVGRDAYDR